MLPALRGRAFNRGSDSAHQVDAIEHFGRRAARALDAATVFGSGVAQAADAYPPNGQPSSSPLGPGVRHHPYGRPPAFINDVFRRKLPRFTITKERSVKRRQPYCALQSLSANDAEAVTAYMLSLNGVVDNNFVADVSGLPKVRMPNRRNFVWRNQRRDTRAKEGTKDCTPSRHVEISRHVEKKSTKEDNSVTSLTTGLLEKAQVRQRNEVQPRECRSNDRVGEGSRWN